MAVRARQSGMIILGGGVVKHHICNANLMVRPLIKYIMLVCFVLQSRSATSRRPGYPPTRNSDLDLLQPFVGGNLKIKCLYFCVVLKKILKLLISLSLSVQHCFYRPRLDLFEYGWYLLFTCVPDDISMNVECILYLVFILFSVIPLLHLSMAGKI